MLGTLLKTTKYLFHKYTNWNTVLSNFKFLLYKLFLDDLCFIKLFPTTLEIKCTKSFSLTLKSILGNKSSASLADFDGKVFYFTFIL